MKVAEGGMPSKNKIMDAKVIEGSAKSEKVKEVKKKLDWVEEWICRRTDGADRARTSDHVSPDFLMIVQERKEKERVGTS
jgi:hypothetical protein